MELPETPDINIVIPLYNEEDGFNLLINRILQLIPNLGTSIEVILVDDGSKDSTPDLMRQLSLRDPRFQSIFLSRNFGHQLALSAGLQLSNAREAVVIMDGDLQDPPELALQFYEQYKKGYDVVYAIREKRKEPLSLRIAYKLFYKIMRKFSYIDIPLNTGDFALLSRRVVDQINSMPEESRFLRGMRSWVGFAQIGIPYERNERQRGDSKYSLLKLISLAMNGIFNFSKYPIRFMMILGILAMSSSIIYFIITLIKKIFWGDVPVGFTALLFAIILFGGLQLIAMGILGEYILRIFFQVKNRPHFIVQGHIAKGKILTI